MRVLAAEDNPVFQSMLKTMLTKWGYEAVMARDGIEALGVLEGENPPRLAVLDWMMPGMDGVDVCRKVRAAAREPYIYLLLLTARTESQDLIEGMDAGADDYLTKPYEYREVLARVHALLRRGPTTYYDVIEVGDLRIELKSRTVARAGRPIELTAKEYAILECLARRQGQVLTREDLSEHAWDENYDVFSNVIEVYILRLRKKIDAGHEVKLLRTRRGEGYVLTNEDCRHD
jgi:two-component system copper resistance phosphate regulon response regulator CusR